MRERDLDEKQNDEGDAEKHAIMQFHRQGAIEGTGAEIDSNRSDDTDGIKTGQGGEISGRDNNDYGQADRDQDRQTRNAVTVELGKNRWHFMVARHHVKQPDHRDDGGVGGTDEQEKENDAHDPAEGLTEKRTETLGAELFADEAQGIFTAEMEGFPHGMREIGRAHV